VLNLTENRAASAVFGHTPTLEVCVVWPRPPKPRLGHGLGHGNHVFGHGESNKIKGVVFFLATVSLMDTSTILATDKKSPEYTVARISQQNQWCDQNLGHGFLGTGLTVKESPNRKVNNFHTKVTP
jgi:hypothetical protein